MRLILHAPNVHEGGGATLLSALISANVPDVPRLVTVDVRFSLPEQVSNSVTVTRVVPTIVGRLQAEWHLRRTAREGDVVLCLGNLPPLFRLRAQSNLFVQNRLLVEDFQLKEFPWAVRFRILAERLWLRGRIATVQCVVVQTPTMQRLMMRNLGRQPNVMSFLPGGCPPKEQFTQEEQRKRFDFLYVSNGLPHKNHVRLIEAWMLLAAQDVRPSLAVTLSPEYNVELCRLIDEGCRVHGLNIVNLGAVPAEQIHTLYGDTRAFIYPSLLESFGLPLLEAAAAKLPIVAAEADYVRDLLDPAQTFDPRSAVSIARAVKRQLGIVDTKTQPVDAAAFLNLVLGTQRKEPALQIAAQPANSSGETA